MLKNWWKFLAVILIAYSIIAGLLIPLAPGITGVTPSRMTSGNQEKLTIEGYNTHFSEVVQQRAWLKVDDTHFVQAGQIEVQGEKALIATFNIPHPLPNNADVAAATLILENKIDGISVLPSATFISKGNPSALSANWQEAPTVQFQKAGFTFPFRNILKETIRNTFYHVPMWLAMMTVFMIAVVFSIKFLRNRMIEDDRLAVSFTSVGFLLGLMGTLTGVIWGGYTWGAFWSWDVRQNTVAIALLIYAAYFILRRSIADLDNARRVSAVFNIFSFAMLIPLIYIIPRMTESLHPGVGGNPAFAVDDLDNTMRMVFYPAVIGWILFATWIAINKYRLLSLEDV